MYSQLRKRVLVGQSTDYLRITAKLAAADSDTLAAAAHPGWTETNLRRHSGLMRFLNRFLGQNPPMGALPTLMAATEPGLNGGEYFGPGGLMGMRGYPKKVQSSDRSYDEQVAAKLWEISEELTDVNFGALDQAKVG